MCKLCLVHPLISLSTRLLWSQVTKWWVSTWLKEVTWLMDSKLPRKRCRLVRFILILRCTTLILRLLWSTMMLCTRLLLFTNLRLSLLDFQLILGILTISFSVKFVMILVHTYMPIWLTFQASLLRRKQMTHSNMQMWSRVLRTSHLGDLVRVLFSLRNPLIN